MSFGMIHADLSSALKPLCQFDIVGAKRLEAHIAVLMQNCVTSPQNQRKMKLKRLDCCEII